jgi:uncharacterized damage-inducible protein DinB
MNTAAEKPAVFTLSTLVKDYARYNRWAHETLITWLRTKPAALLEQTVPSSYPSIKLTLLHIWDTERFWLSVLQQKPAPKSYTWEGFDGTLEDVLQGIVAFSTEVQEYIEGLSDEEIIASVEFNSPWANGIRSRAEFLHHTMTHGVYHRGQVITIGRNLGFTDAPMTDYNFYLTVK